MRRRNVLVFATTAVIGPIGGCLSATECDETSNHLYIENQRADPQEIAVQVLKETDGLFADRDWEAVFRDDIELPDGEHRIVEDVYDEYGTYRTVAEQRTGHDALYEREIADVDDCHDQSVTIGIADGRLDILQGVPDHLASETDSDS